MWVKLSPEGEGMKNHFAQSQNLCRTVLTVDTVGETCLIPPCAMRRELEAPFAKGNGVKFFATQR